MEMWRGRFFVMWREIPARRAEQAMVLMNAAMFPHLEQKDRRRVVGQIERARGESLIVRASEASTVEDREAALEQFKLLTAAGAGLAFAPPPRSGPPR
jgi:hypothetical protein